MGSPLLYGSALVLLYGWVLLGSPEGLVPARLMDTSQHYEWARANTMDSFCSALWMAFLYASPMPL